MADDPLAVKQARQRHVAGALGQADVVLQEDRHPDGGDQRNQALGVTHRPIGHAFNAPAVGAGNHNGAHESGGDQQPASVNAHHHQRGDDHKGDIAANHIDLAVGEVDHADNAVHHRIADGDQRIGTAQRDAVKHLLQKIEKLLGHKVTFFKPPAVRGRRDNSSSALISPRSKSRRRATGRHQTQIPSDRLFHPRSAAQSRFSPRALSNL